MPFIDRKSGLTPANARAVDVAHRLTETIAPMQQQRYLDAFRVQGIQALLYSKLQQGRKCLCHSKNVEASRLSPDGKASPGAINRILTGNSNFGISNYNPVDNDLTLNPYEHETSPLNGVSKWRGDLNKVGGDIDDEFNQIEDEPTLGDNGQFSPDFENLFEGFDMSTLGFSDVSCPICFGTGYVGGYSPFRAWRHVIIPTELETTSYFDLPTFELSPGTHSCKITLPKGAVVLDVFRAMNKDQIVGSKFFLDGADITNRRLLDYCDGRPHEFTIEAPNPITHIEIQFGLSKEPVYFEIPKLSKTHDLSLLEQQEPFNILMSPDIPHLDTLDIIAESQLGKILIVQQNNPWNTRNRNMLGYECSVRVAQPQELWNLLPHRRHVTGQKRVRAAAPTKGVVASGVSTLKGFSF